MAKAVRRRGATSEAWDIVYGPSFDLTVESNIRRLLRRLRRGTIHAVWLGIECRTFSTARRPPLRSSAHPDGLPGLAGRDLAACLHGNLLAEAGARIVSVAASLGIPVAVENPHRSLLWHHSAFEKLAVRWPPQRTTLDYCCFGTPWRKRTTFWSWHLDLSNLGRLCSSKKGKCDRTGLTHVHLVGRNTDKKLLTQIAEPYPSQLVDHLSSIIATAIQP